MTYPKKKKRQQTSLERLLFGRKFGFYDPYPIEECAALLLARSEREPGIWGYSNKLLVTVKQDSQAFIASACIGTLEEICTPKCLEPSRAKRTRRL
jgi:hypothetical protein